MLFFRFLLEIDIIRKKKSLLIAIITVESMIIVSEMVGNPVDALNWSILNVQSVRNRQFGHCTQRMYRQYAHCCVCFASKV